MIKYLFFLGLILISGCTGIPEGLQPVTGFEVNRYLGTWHEIARLDHRFERGLDEISADYQSSNDGGLQITNSGRNVETGKREYAYGKAYFIGESGTGSLKVSFFGPFYGGYHIIELDKTNYSYVMIAGNSKDYLWILARQPKLDDAVLSRLVNKAKSLGFATDKLIYSKTVAGAR